MRASSANGSSPTQGPRVVITHDFMETYGGAERVTAEIAAAFPDAPVVAIAGHREVARRMGIEDRFTSLIAPRSRLMRDYRLLAPALPALVSRVRLPEADVVLSSSYAFAHRLRTGNGAVRVCYSHSPLRFAWGMSGRYQATWARGPLSARAFGAFAGMMRASDLRSAREVDRYLAPGPNVARQIRDCYGREAEVVAAPVDCALFHPGSEPAEDYYLFAGRLVEPYKRPTMVIEAFNRLGAPLKVAGDGPARRAIERIAGPNIEFLGQLDDAELVPLMQRCRASIFPSEDDFGLVPLESNACGRPVIAFRGGGAIDTVIPGVTGTFFEAQTVAHLEEAVRSFDPDRFDSEDLRAHALRWSAPRFRERIVKAVLQAKAEADAGAPMRELAPV